MDWIASQLVMIIEIFMAKHDSMHALGQETFDAVFDKALITQIDKAAG
jgi:hypothetical protein